MILTPHDSPPDDPLPDPVAAPTGPGATSAPVARPDSPPAAPAPPGSRFEQLLLIVKLIGDLASIPFHLLLFAFTRRARMRRLRQDLTESHS